MRKKIVAGNWKMNLNLQEGVALAKELNDALTHEKPNCSVVICTPFIHLAIDRRDLTSFDEANSQWLGEAGDYAVEVGDNIEDITSSVKVRLSEYTEKVHHVMKPDAQLNLLRQ